jgi:prolyl 4-hydroxylase
MSASQVTPDLRRWIAEQSALGHTPEALLGSMLSSGWSSRAAEQALDEVLRGRPLEVDQTADLPAPVPVPDLSEGAAGAQVLATMTNPRIVILGGMLSHDECDELVALARPKLSRSETLELTTGGNAIHEARTSQGMFFDREENTLCARIERRIAEMFNWPIENGEGLQVLHYGPGAEYKPHYDYFDPAQPGTAPVLRRGGQRVASLVMYLNTPKRGGGTVFPDVQFEVAAVKGNAVFFSYDRAHPATRSLHGGSPVIEGDKWVATKWLRERRFD